MTLLRWLQLEVGGCWAREAPSRVADCKVPLQCAVADVQDGDGEEEVGHVKCCGNPLAEGAVAGFRWSAIVSCAGCCGSLRDAVPECCFAGGECGSRVPL